MSRGEIIMFSRLCISKYLECGFNQGLLDWIQHSFLSISGDYMQVKVHSIVAIAGMVVSMTSPEFVMTVSHCLTFDYEVKSSGETPILEIHTRVTDYMLSGKIIWTSQDYDSQRSQARINLLAVDSSSDLPYVLDFIGIVARPNSTLIRIANVQFSDGHCEHGQTVSHQSSESGTIRILWKYMQNYSIKSISWLYFAEM